MYVTAQTGDGGTYARVGWSDNPEQPCEISGSQFGTLQMSSASLQNLYDCLAFLFERKS